MLILMSVLETEFLVIVLLDQMTAFREIVTKNGTGFGIAVLLMLIVLMIVMMILKLAEHVPIFVLMTTTVKYLGTTAINVFRVLL